MLGMLLTANPAEDMPPEDRDQVAVDLAQQAAAVRRWLKLVIQVEAQVTVAPVQHPVPGGPDVGERGDREPRPLAASALAPGAAGSRRSSGAAGRRRIPPRPGPGHAPGRRPSRPSRSPSPPALTRRPTAPSSAAHALPVAPARLMQTG